MNDSKEIKRLRKELKIPKSNIREKDGTKSDYCKGEYLCSYKGDIILYDEDTKTFNFPIWWHLTVKNDAHDPVSYKDRKVNLEKIMSKSEWEKLGSSSSFEEIKQRLDGVFPLMVLIRENWEELSTEDFEKIESRISPFISNNVFEPIIEKILTYIKNNIHNNDVQKKTNMTVENHSEETSTWDSKKRAVGDSINFKDGRIGVIEDYDENYYYVKDSNANVVKIKKS